MPTSRRCARPPGSAASRSSPTRGSLIGYLHIKDVLEPDEERRERPVADRWIRPFATVSADTLLHDALEVLQRRGAHMARVVQGDGTTLGVAALEDVIEELVGEIRDAAHSDDATTAS
ncbi:CBS domain-containing protein [Nocardioides convexus]|uniref:CBS domain-containing protein n=1 Tax=Nocardioides convexus TaxID=2712224 RepID=UPI003101033D